MNNCIEHQGYKDKAGYGYKWNNQLKRNDYAHRVAYEKKYGPIPKGMHIRHMCNNKSCVNIEHLKIGTHTDNMQDKVRDGMSLKGEKNPKAILSVDEVSDIVSTKKYYGCNKDLAKKYNVSVACIEAIRGGRSWKHIQR